jgi:Tfp pilus assembly protein PilN
MANINLISTRRAERVRLTRVARGLIAAIVGTGVLAVGTVAYLATCQFVTAGELTTAEAKLSQLRPILEEIENAERERGSLQPKLVTLGEAQQKTNRWNGILDGLKRVVPTQTWLTSVAVEGNAESGRLLRVNGITANQSRVGETMFRLTQQPDYYSKVDLRFTRATKINDRDNVEFELAAQLAQPQLDTKVQVGRANQAN